MSWVAAPLSDQEENMYVAPPEVCGDTTPRVRWMPTTPTTCAGVVRGWPSSVICSPDGFVAKDMVDLRGTTSRYVELSGRPSP